MTAQTELDQLIEAVKRQPGARAFALLAEKYLEQGEIDHAVDVCQRGFSVNPAYERGAVAYLKALRAKGEIDLAAQVYGRAVAEHPRSAQLRVAWAMVLLDAGREPEARLRAREAVDLDPMDKEARAVLATLGATPPPALRKTGGIELKRPAPDDSGELGDAPPPIPADLRPRLPTIKTGAPHAQFDLTPAPVMVDPSQRTSIGADEAPPLDALVDFFGVDEPMPAPGQPATPPSPPAAPPPLPPPAPLTLDEPIQLEPAVEPPPAEPAPPIFTPEIEAEQAYGSLFPPQPARRPPPPEIGRSSAQPRADGTAELPSLPLEPTRSKSRLRVVLLIVAGVLLLFGPVAGYLVYRHVKTKAAAAALAAAAEQVRRDRLADYREARATTCTLAAKRPKDAPIVAACALFSAHLSARFRPAAAPLKREARSALERARAAAPKHRWTRVAASLVALRDGDPQAALAAIEGAPEADWHLLFARASAQLARFDLAAASKTLAKPAAAERAAPALLHLAARVARLAGDHRRALALIERGLGAEVQHPGLAVERALVRAETGKAVKLAPLPKLAGDVPRLQAAVALVEAYQRAAAGAHGEAAKLARRAASFAGPIGLEARWREGTWLLGPGGDAAKGLAALEKASAFIRLRPGAVLDQIAALLLMGKLQRAATLLGGVDREKLGSARKAAHDALAVRIAGAMDNLRRLDDLCPNDPPAELALAQAVACVEAFVKTTKIGRTRRWVRTLRKRLGRKSQVLRFLTGLAVLARGDARRAVHLLAKTKPAAPLEPAAIPLARTRALLAHRKPKAAVAEARKALQLDAGSVRSRVPLAEALVAAGHDSEAYGVLEAVATARPTDPTILAGAGQIFLKLGRAKNARQLLKDAEKYYPKSVSLRLLAGHVALAAEALDDARRHFDQVRKLVPGHTAALVALGQIAARQGKARKAKLLFKRAIRRRPKDPELRLQLALAYARTRNWSGALNNGKLAIRWFKRSQPRRALAARVILGSLLRRGNRRARGEAETMLWEACKATDAPAQAFFEFAMVHRADKDKKRALWSFREAIKRDPLMAKAHFQLALTYWSKRKWRGKARAHLRQYLKLQPKGDHAAKAKSLLARKR